jgi:hypothetical protein
LLCTTSINCDIIDLSNNPRKIMAGKAKSIYLTINPKGTFKMAFHKVFFDAKAYNEYVKTDEFKEKWPVAEFTIVKETY